MNNPNSEEKSWSAVTASSKLLKITLAIIGGFMLSYFVYIWTGGDYVNDDWNSPSVWYAVATAVAPVVFYVVWYFRQIKKQKDASIRK